MKDKFFEWTGWCIVVYGFALMLHAYRPELAAIAAAVATVIVAWFAYDKGWPGEDFSRAFNREMCRFHRIPYERRSSFCPAIGLFILGLCLVLAILFGVPGTLWWWWTVPPVTAWIVYVHRFTRLRWLR